MSHQQLERGSRSAALVSAPSAPPSATAGLIPLEFGGSRFRWRFPTGPAPTIPPLADPGLGGQQVLVVVVACMPQPLYRTRFAPALRSAFATENILQDSTGKDMINVGSCLSSVWSIFGSRCIYRQQSPSSSFSSILHPERDILADYALSTRIREIRLRSTRVFHVVDAIPCINLNIQVRHNSDDGGDRPLSKLKFKSP